MKTPDAEGAYVIAAGKTGGHIFPGIALACEVRARRPRAPILFVGTAGGLETRLVPEAGFPIEYVRASGFVGKRLVAKLAALASLPIGFLQARRILRRHRARAVAGMGGYVSIPVLSAARSLKIPTLVHDSDAQPGVANRLLNRFATRTALGWEAANAHLARRGIVTGTPVRREFFAVPPLGSIGRRVLVFGGSQGSVILNDAAAAAARRLAAAGVQVIHQTGENNLASARARYGSVPDGWRLAPFLPRLYEELAWADLVVSRAGATTLAELAAAGRPAILVPFGSAANAHQLANARVLERAGAAVVIEETRLNGELLAEEVLRLLSDPPELVRMGVRARALAHPDAARRLAELLWEAEEEGAA